MTGRPRKPTRTQIAAGDPGQHGVRKLQQRLEAEPKATQGYPPCPEQLQGRARACWEFLAPEIEIMDLDRRPDAVMLEGCCAAYGQAVEADLLVAAQGVVIEEPLTNNKGDVVGYKTKVNPAFTVSNSSWKQVRAFCSEFGLSPVSRTRLSIERKDETQDLAAILSQERPARPAVQ